MVKSPPAPSTLCIQFLDRENNDQKIHYHWENRFFFYKSMGLYGNFTAVMSIMANKKTNWTRKEIFITKYSLFWPFASLSIGMLLNIKTAGTDVSVVILSPGCIRDKQICSVTVTDHITVYSYIRLYYPIFGAFLMWRAESNTRMWNENILFLLVRAKKNSASFVNLSARIRALSW